MWLIFESFSVRFPSLPVAAALRIAARAIAAAKASNRRPPRPLRTFLMFSPLVLDPVRGTITRFRPKATNQEGLFTISHPVVHGSVLTGVFVGRLETYDQG